METNLIKNYDDLYMRRLLHHNMEIQNLFLKMMPSRDYGHTELRIIFNTLVVKRSDLLHEYRGWMGMDHKIEETSITRLLKLLVDTHGWDGLIDGFIQLARNRKEFLRRLGMAENEWTKIIELLEKMPKRPQF